MIIEDILQRYENIGKVCDYVVIDNLLCVSCYVKTDSAYFLVLDDGTIIYKDYACKDYISEFNKEGYGNGLVIIDLTCFQIVQSFYFKDYNNWDSPIEIGFSCSDYLVISFQSKSHIFFTKDFSLLILGSPNYRIYEPYIILFPYSDYDGNFEFSLFDTTTREIVYLSKFLPDDPLHDDPFYPYPDNVFIIDKKLVGRKNGDLHNNEGQYSIPIDFLFGRNVKLQDSRIHEREICNIEPIEEIKPIEGYSLGVYKYDATNHCSESDSSYVSELLYLIKNKFRKDKINELAHILKEYVSMHHSYHKFDVIIPVPCSDKSRQFQPLYEIIKALSTLVHIPCDFEYLLSTDKKPIKTIKDEEERKRILDKTLYITDEYKYADKKILLIDDHIYSGDTIKTCISKCKCAEIFVLVISRNEIFYNLPGF